MAKYKRDNHLWCRLFICASAILYNWQSFLYCRHVSFCVGEHLLHQEKDVRNLQNDLAEIAFCSLQVWILLFSGPHFSTEKIWVVPLYPLIFIGTMLYVKSLMRERNKNPLYLKASIIYPVALCTRFLFTQQCSSYHFAFFA